MDKIVLKLNIVSIYDFIDLNVRYNTFVQIFLLTKELKRSFHIMRRLTTSHTYALKNYLYAFVFGWWHFRNKMVVSNAIYNSTLNFYSIDYWFSWKYFS